MKSYTPREIELLIDAMGDVQATEQRAIDAAMGNQESMSNETL